ncbi:hypothetical protein GCM10010424_36030 [Streptomyces lienomycini]
MVGQHVLAPGDPPGDVTVVVEDLHERSGDPVVVLGQQYLHPAASLRGGVRVGAARVPGPVARQPGRNVSVRM